jgi:hypothetical protein
MHKEKEKRNWVEGGEKIKLQKKLRSGLNKGKQKKVSLGWDRDRKENPISAPSIHVGALVGAGSLWAPSTHIGQFDTYYIILRNVEIFNFYFFQIKKIL